MLSTWKFYAFRGHLPRSTAETACRSAFNQARLFHKPNELIGAETRRWSATYFGAGTVDLVLVPRPHMTWRMWVEGLAGAELAVDDGREFQFIIMAAGVEGEVGYGQMTSRESATGRKLAARAGGERNLTLPVYPPVRASGVKTYVPFQNFVRCQFLIDNVLTQRLQCQSP